MSDVEEEFLDHSEHHEPDQDDERDAQPSSVPVYGDVAKLLPETDPAESEPIITELFKSYEDEINAILPISSLICI